MIAGHWKAVVACSPLFVASTACTLEPLDGSDGGTTSSTGTTGSTQTTVGDQCQDVLSEYCQSAITCTLLTNGLADCISNALPLCCVGSQCNAISTVSESTVDACKMQIAAESCFDLSQTTGNPASCLQSS